ncbi:tautomerase family protein [Marinobacterium iners]|uniref:4-oxalocrotonate tautomerase n=1 Tax=Marinobacterium iners DSM 11526 TaxID=1122198 RepID=A0A1H3XW51_9GAMM|nr:tautomerase family protein [Marinobacterium iners]SEA03081.1 4-oxalocrotonate tautomerase [Marinobacterium iners DSM 11526]
MPIIEMHLLVGRSSEDKARAASAITAAAAESLGVKPDTVRILITEHGKDEFYVAGRAGRASDQAAAEAAQQEATK